jgi:pseudaminic acid synthase
VKLAGVPIGMDVRPFIVAEMSANHNQSIERAIAIVRAAASSGANALKLQTYRPEMMTLDIRGGLFTIREPGSPWDGESLFDLYRKGAMPWEWHEEIFQCARELGMVPFSSPFDAQAIELLERLGCEVYKVASFEVSNHPLIKQIAMTGKPMIMSTGMATVAEIDQALTAFHDAGGVEYALLKCTSAYPASGDESNLLTIPHMRDLFRCEVGVSDHTPGVGAALAGVALGASIIEKHFTLSRAEDGIDASFSIEPNELALLVQEADRARRARGRVAYGPTGSERFAHQYRRSIYVVDRMMAGERLSANNIRCIRPGGGLHPCSYDVVLGRKVVSDVEMGTPLTWELIE